MKYILITFIAGLLIGAFIFKLLFWPKVESSTVITEKIEWVKKDTTIINYKDSLRLRVVDVQPSLEPEKYDSIRTYRGIERFEYGSLEWEASTLGSLDFLKFKPTINIPTKTITKETTVVKKTKGLYAQAWLDINSMYPAPGLTYVNDRLIIGYRYTPLNKTHSISAGLKIF